MKRIISDIKTLILSLIGLIGGTIWAVLTHWEPEPIILISVSVIEIIAFSILARSNSNRESAQTITSTINKGNVNVNVNVGAIPDSDSNTEMFSEKQLQESNREEKIDLMKSKTKILFVDDDNDFKVVRILKDSGWKHTKSVIDIKSIDSPIVKDAHIHFIDINGVGKILNLPNEGLDLALMIKQRYPAKKVVIYSANRNSNSFHEAWNLCDFKLEKNALPNQFQNLVENYSLELFNEIK